MASDRVTVPGGGSDPLARELREEWDALGNMSYHGIGTASNGETMWRADLDPSDVGKFRTLLMLAVAELAGLRERLAETEAANKELDDRNRWRWPAERQRADDLAEQLREAALEQATETSLAAALAIRGYQLLEAEVEALRVERDTAVDALRQIASGQFVNQVISDPTPTVIDGQEATVTYVERLTAMKIAAKALAAVGGQTA